MAGEVEDLGIGLGFYFFSGVGCGYGDTIVYWPNGNECTAVSGDMGWLFCGSNLESTQLNNLNRIASRVVCLRCT